MKTKFILYIFSYLIIIISLYSCRDNCQFWKKEHKTDLPEGIKKYIRPFQQEGKTWIYSNSDSSDFDTIKVIDFYSNYSEVDNPCDIRENNIVNINGTLKTTTYSPNWPVTLTASCGKEYSTFYSNLFYIVYDNNGLYKSGSTATVTYYDSIYLKNIFYNHVIEYSNLSFDLTGTTFFISPEFGIIHYKIDTTNYFLINY